MELQLIKIQRAKIQEPYKTLTVDSMPLSGKGTEIYIIVVHLKFRTSSSARFRYGLSEEGWKETVTASMLDVTTY